MTRKLVSVLRQYTLFWRFTALSLVAFAALAAFTVRFVQPAIEDFFLTETERQAVVFVNRDANLALTRADFAYPRTTESAAHLAAFAQVIPVRGLIEATIYDPSGRVLHPADQVDPLYTQKAAKSVAFLEALYGEVSPASFEALTPEEARAFGTDEVLSIYIPITIGAEPEPVGILHAVARTGLVRGAIEETQREVARRLALGLAALYATLAVIVWEASYRLVRQANALREGAERLSRSLEKEQELSGVKDKFLSSASHQLKTPVSEIGWAVESMRTEQPGTDAFRAAVASIENGWRTLQSIVSNLITASEIGFRYEVKGAEEVDTFEVTEDVLLDLSDTARDRGVTVRFTPKGNEPFVKANRGALSKVLRILIDNAITYSSAGGEVTISIAAERGVVTWRIQDQGIGIPGSDQQRVFDQFFRARNAIERKNVGSGISLFIAKTIVEGHGGEIGFTSEERKGSTFWFSLPA